MRTNFNGKLPLHSNSFALVNDAELKALLGDDSVPVSSNRKSTEGLEKSLKLMANLSRTIGEDVNSPVEMIELRSKIEQIISTLRPQH